MGVWGDGLDGHLVLFGGLGMAFLGLGIAFGLCIATFPEREFCPQNHQYPLSPTNIYGRWIFRSKTCGIALVFLPYKVCKSENLRNYNGFSLTVRYELMVLVGL